MAKKTDEQIVIVTMSTHSALPRSTSSAKMSESIKIKTPIRNPA